VLRADLDPDSGWCPIFVKSQPGELGTAVILGEFVHDLRSALDYIVTALADREQIRLTQYHQFPIAYTRGGYTKAVKDCLRGISDVPLRLTMFSPTT
jgi:hypothetical protein